MALNLERSPVYFGPPSRPLFGWLHTPSSDARTLGVVVCNPFGYEAVCAHRALKHLAQRTAAAGYPSLRFDYDGTGDSAGSDADPDRVDAWIASIDQAIDTLRARTGVRRVALVGLRLGATLALHAAQRRDDIEGIAAIATVPRGRAYLRELKAYHAAIGLPPAPGTERDPRWSADVFESAGFIMTETTTASVGQLDLDSLSWLNTTIRRVLVLERGKQPSPPPWTRALMSSGVEVETGTAHGYAEMMLDAHLSAVPNIMLDRVVGWLDAGSTVATTIDGAYAQDRIGNQPATTSACRIDAQVEETPTYLGDETPCFAILSQPAASRAPPTTAIVLLNAGALCRVGPNRLHVEWARRWASLGVLVSRVDLPGLGDAPPGIDQPENTVYPTDAILRIRSAIEELVTQHGIRDVRLVGLCSGAYHALHVAAQSEVVSHVVVINPLTFHWRPTMTVSDPPHRTIESAKRYRSYATRPSTWLRLFTRAASWRAVAKVILHRTTMAATGYFWELRRAAGFRSDDDVSVMLQRIVDRGGYVHFVFSESDPGEELLMLEAGRATRRLLRQGVLSIDRIAGANHTFTARWAQQAVGETIGARVATS